MSMEINMIITIAAIVVANIGTTIGLFTWATSHAANDSRETKRILEAIQSEMKDFHGRLCSIEERNSSKTSK
jgi:hypothetical protein